MISEEKLQIAMKFMSRDHQEMAEEILMLRRLLREFYYNDFLESVEDLKILNIVPPDYYELMKEVVGE